MKSYIKEIMDNNSKKKIIFFGAGRFFKSFIKEFCIDRKLLSMPKYVCDNNTNLYGNNIYGIPIVSPEKLKYEKPEDTLIIVSTTFLEVLEQLKSMGMYYFPIIPAPSVEAYFYFKNNKEKLDNVVQLFEDDKSKIYFKNYIENLTNGVIFNPGVYDLNPYYGNDVINKLEDFEVIVSGGTYNGNHIDRALKLNKNIKFYAFEPNSKYSEFLKHKYKSNSNIKIYDYALYNENTEVYFDDTIDVSAKIADKSEVDCKNVIKTVTMDSIIKDKVTLIEMDIEGSEMKALIGASDIILKFKPKLAICIYHKIEDYLDIPLYIKSLNSNYKLFFRQHSCFNVDSVLYAI